MILRHKFDLALKAWLVQKTNKQVGLAEVPAQNPDLPYAILYSLTTGTVSGSWADPEEDAVMFYQVRSVGGTYQQCAALSDLVRQKMIGRGTGGSFDEPMILESTNVQNRETHQLGGIMPSGDNLFEVVDLYRLTIGA